MNAARIIRRSRTDVLPALLLAAALAAAIPAAGGLRLAEIMAENDGFLHDADGDSPDWIEILNDSLEATNLAGWHLTDTPTNLALWTLPATNLPAGGRLVVFASGKDRAAAGAELHTNFLLDQDGGYVALVRPDGATIADAFAPYPPQRANASYGPGRDILETPLVPSGAVGRVLVPAHGALGTNWIQPGFDDSAWTPAATGIGYDRPGSATNPARETLLRLDFSERGQDPAPLTPAGFTPFLLASNGSATAIQTAGTTRAFGGLAVTVSNTAPDGYDDRLRTTPTNSGAFTDAPLLRDFVFSRSTTTGGLDVAIAGLPAGAACAATLWSFDSGNAGQRVSDWFANGVPVRTNYAFDGALPPISNDTCRILFDADADAAGRLVLAGRRDPSGLVNAFAVFLNALELVRFSYGPYIATDVAPAMSNVNASVYLRLPFVVADPGAVHTLRLRVRYDDGFVAYLNGREVASRRAPAAPAWNAAAASAQPNSAALAGEDIVFTNQPGLLLAGTNVLALHGLNASAGDPDFLLLPQLDAVAAVEYPGRFFKPATPGAENGRGFAGFTADTKFSADRGFYDQPFAVAITCATPGASIWWTTNGSPPSPTNGARYAAPVPVQGTTLLRALATAPDVIPTEIDTHTYIFLDQVLAQPASIPGCPTNWEAAYPADYAMDPVVTGHPVYGAEIRDDLRAFPTLSLVTDHDSLWGPTNGLYTHVNISSDAQRDAMERAAGAELILPGGPHGETAFAVNCGLRMQGNASRDNIRTPKHSFRMLFKSAYGPSKLRYDWFPGAAADAFDNVVVKAGFCDTWATRYSPTGLNLVLGQRYRPEDAAYVRDPWMKDSHAAMGWNAARSTFVHLYINGLYWGLYNPCERLDAAHWAACFGGRELDWDVIRDNVEVLDGSLADWSQLMVQVNAGITNEAAYQAVAQLVDLDSLIDYMLLHFHAEAEDWGANNWYAAHRRAGGGLPATKWIFAVWDQEIVCDQSYPRNRVDIDVANSPSRIYAKLRAWPEFRVRFGDRAHRHLFHAGALTATSCVSRFRARADEIGQALVGESARWGDARETATPGCPPTGQTFTRDEWWTPEVQGLVTNWFPNQTAITLDRLRAASLYPGAGAPDFSPYGGPVPAGFTLALSHTNADGVIYLATDGSDPRAYGSGAVATSAFAYAGPVPINAPLLVRARVLRGGLWSALAEAPFYPPQDLSRLVLTEIMYHPLPAGPIDDDEFEFLELKNTGANVLDLSGLAFTAGVSFAFPMGSTLAPGGFCVLARSAAAFTSRYPAVSLAGVYTGRLDNGGEALTLAHPSGAIVLSVAYGGAAPWPATAGGIGFSLVPRDGGLTQAPDDGARWRASASVGGSPGADDPAPAPIPAVVINEALTHTDPPRVDAIELHNPTAAPADVGGWFLTDDRTVPAKFRIPTGTVIAAGGYAVFTTNAFGQGTNAFALSELGEEVYLFAADAAGSLLGYGHGFAFGAADEGVSFGRHLNSAGEEQFPAQAAITLGSANAGPRTGPVTMSEIHYHPPPGDDEFLELENVTETPVPLFDPLHPTNTWRLEGLGFAFPTNVTLPPRGLVLLVATNPADFRVRHGVPAEVPVFGPCPGTLQDSGERLALEHPGAPETNGVVPYVVTDEVRYNDKAAWPAAADGGGRSLQRIVPGAYGNDPTNWHAAAPTPGRTNAPPDADDDGLPDAWETANGTDPGIPDADADPDLDGQTNAQEFRAGTSPTNAASFLRLESLVRLEDGPPALTFTAAAGRAYTLEQRDAPDDGAWTSWVSVASSPTARVVTVTDTNTPRPSWFYRLLLP